MSSWVEGVRTAAATLAAMHALVLAGGRGTRLRPLTDHRPKPLMPFMGWPFAAGLLHRLAEAGCTEATFLVGPDAQPFGPIRALGAEVGVDVALVTEETPLDTAGAARRVVRAGLEGPVVVCNGDILTDLDLRALVDRHVDAGAAATLALTRVADTSSFGVVDCGADGRVHRFVEKPPPGTLAPDTVNSGTYVLDPSAFDPFPGDGPLSFERAVFPGLLESGASVLGVPSDAYWLDLGTPTRYLEGHAAVLAGRCAWPSDPALQLDERPAGVHPSAAIDPGAALAGVVVGPECVIEAGARLCEVVLHRGARVGAEAVVEQTVLGEGAAVGAGERIGPGAVLADGERRSDGAA